MKVITANRLIDGEVVFQGPEGTWVELIGAARVLADKEEIAAALALGVQAVAARLIVEPYEIDVIETDGRLEPARFREKIRAAGPTTHPALGKQARETA